MDRSVVEADGVCRNRRPVHVSAHGRALAMASSFGTVNPKQRRLFAIILAAIIVLGVLAGIAAPLLATYTG